MTRRLAIATPLWFAFLVLMNAPHLGVNAALHWDSTASIATSDPMPTAAELAAARGHVFDLAAEARSDDPAVVTAYFLSPAAAGRHGPLETVRRYYSQVSYAVARAAFATGSTATHSPTGGVVAFQLTAAALVAVALGGLTALAWPHGHRAMTLLAFAAVAGSPVFLSISRQVLTETVGLALLVAGLLSARVAVRRPWVAVAAGIVLFLAVRSRYNIAFAIVALLPLALPARPGLRPILIGCATFGLCVAVDAATYGPLFMPWVYDDALVRSTRLYFHTDPPYDAFWTAMYVNGPLLVLPVLGIACGWLGAGRAAVAAGSRLRLRGLAYPTLVLLLLAIPLTTTARQQVRYQPRHLFPFTGLAACVLLLTVARLPWRRWTAIPFAAACLVTIGLDVYSTLGPQRTTMRVPWPATIAQTFRHRWTMPGPHPPWPRLLLDGYFDWSDNTRVHDQLLTMQYKQRQPNDPLLVVSGGVDGSGLYCRWATRFAPPVIWWPPTGTGDTKTVDAALAAGRPVLAVLPVGGSLTPYATESTGVLLDEAVFVRVRQPR